MISIPLNFTVHLPEGVDVITGHLTIPATDRSPAEYVVAVVTRDVEPTMRLYGGNGRFITRAAALLWVEDNVADDPKVRWFILPLHDPKDGHR